MKFNIAFHIRRTAQNRKAERNAFYFGKIESGIVRSFKNDFAHSFFARRYECKGQTDSDLQVCKIYIQPTKRFYIYHSKSAEPLAWIPVLLVDAAIVLIQ